MRILLVDHQDSFTGNLYQDLGVLVGRAPEVVDHRDALRLEQRVRATGPDRPELIVLSAGPGHPRAARDAGHSPALVRAVVGRIPLFGVCFGLQVLVTTLGGRVIEAREIVHGMSRPIHHGGNGLFAGLRRPTPMMRYHSLVVDRDALPAGFDVTAWSEAGEPMAVAHQRARIQAVQFHPESIGSPEGTRLLGNVLRWCREQGERTLREAPEAR